VRYREQKRKKRGKCLEFKVRHQLEGTWEISEKGEKAEEGGEKNKNGPSAGSRGSKRHRGYGSDGPGRFLKTSTPNRRRGEGDGKGRREKPQKTRNETTNQQQKRRFLSKQGKEKLGRLGGGTNPRGPRSRQLKPIGDEGVW